MRLVTEFWTVVRGARVILCGAFSFSKRMKICNGGTHDDAGWWLIAELIVFSPSYLYSHIKWLYCSTAAFHFHYWFWYSSSYCITLSSSSPPTKVENGLFQQKSGWRWWWRWWCSLASASKPTLCSISNNRAERKVPIFSQAGQEPSELLEEKELNKRRAKNTQFDSLPLLY